MRFPLGRQAETASQFEASERDAVSARRSFRKRHPSLTSWNGTRFPLGGRSGNCIPEFSLKAGYAFQMEIQAETATQNIASEWDAVSGWHHLRKRRPTLIIRNEKKSWSCASLRGFPALVKQTYRMRCAASRKLSDDLGAAGRLASNLIRWVVSHAIRCA